MDTEAPEPSFPPRIPLGAALPDLSDKEFKALQKADKGATTSRLALEAQSARVKLMAGQHGIKVGGCGRLHFEQTVENRGAEPMPFSTGIHPYFQVPLTTQSGRNQCFVRIPACELLTADARYEHFTATALPAPALDADKAQWFMLTGRKRNTALWQPGRYTARSDN